MTKTRTGKTFLLSFKIYPSLNFTASLSLSLFLQWPQCFPRARKSHRERPMFRTLLSASFQTFRIYSEISRQFYEPFPSYKRSVTTLLGVTKERGKSWICKGRERERERERATRVSTDGKVEFQRAS